MLDWVAVAEGEDDWDRGEILLVSVFIETNPSSLRIADYNGFLRLKIDPHGNVTVYPIIVEHVPQTDDGPLLTRLVEKPIEVCAMA
jgi:hypothetical protein